MKSLALPASRLILRQHQKVFSASTVRNGPRHFSAATPNQSEGRNGQKIGDYVTGPTTHFGYEDVSVEAKESRVREVFESVADNYDIMNDLMSAGLHRLWKDELLRITGVEAAAKALRRRAAHDHQAEPLLSILDVAGGTGDVAFRFINAAGCAERSRSSGGATFQSCPGHGACLPG